MRWLDRGFGLMTAHIYIFIHGMTPESQPSSVIPKFKRFWNRLVDAQPKLQSRFDKQVYVQWGHQLPEAELSKLRPDERLTMAQNNVDSRISFDSLKKMNDKHNGLLTGFWHHDWGIGPLRKIVIGLKENIVLRGVGDVVYYGSPEGEVNVRKTVYQQALASLDVYLSDPDVYFHLAGDSLGVTLTHDFLYGLFAKNHTPGFIKEAQGDDKTVHRFSQWRQKAQEGTLKLGSLISSGSQLPLMLFRKQGMIDLLFNDQYLDPASIGVRTNNKIQWKLFYDVDDVLGFSTRMLYAPNNCIREYQVRSGVLPEAAHVKYWENKTVIKEAAAMVLENSQ